jgi:hypothetical protein
MRRDDIVYKASQAIYQSNHSAETFDLHAGRTGRTAEWIVET